jgi:hypothetical protein
VISNQLCEQFLTDIIISTLTVDALVARSPEGALRDDVCDNSAPDCCVCIFAAPGVVSRSASIIKRRIVSDRSTSECMYFIQTTSSLGPVGLPPPGLNAMGPWYPIVSVRKQLVVCNRGCGSAGCTGSCCPSYTNRTRGTRDDVGWNSVTARIVEEALCNDSSSRSMSDAWYAEMDNHILASASIDPRLQASEFATQTSLRFASSRFMLAALNNASLAAKNSVVDKRRHLYLVARLMFRSCRAFENELPPCVEIGARVNTVAGDPTKFNSLVEIILKHILSNTCVSEAMSLRIVDDKVTLSTNGNAALVNGPKWLESRRERALSAIEMFKSFLFAVEATVSTRFDALLKVRRAVSTEILSMEQKDVNWKEELGLLIDTSTINLESAEDCKMELSIRNAKLKVLHSEFIVHLRMCLRNCRTEIAGPWKAFATHAKALLMMGVLFDFCPVSALIESASECVQHLATEKTAACTRINTVDNPEALAKLFFAVPRTGGRPLLSDSAHR